MSDVPDYQVQDWAVRREMPVHSIIGSNRMLRVGVEGYYEAEKWSPSTLVNPKEIWSLDEGVFTITDEMDGVSLRTKRTYNYMTVETKLPDISGTGAKVWLGFENGSVVGSGINAFRLYDDAGTVRLYGVSSSGWEFVTTEITDALPSDFDTATHCYSIIVRKGFSEFFIDNDLVFIGINGYNIADVGRSYPPYAVRTAQREFSRNVPGLLEIICDGEVNWEIDPVLVRFAREPEEVPRHFQLYDKDASTLMTDGTYATGTTHLSHPYPVLGYDERAMLFLADTDSTTDGLIFTGLTAKGAFRSFNKTTYSANDFLRVLVDYPFLAVRVQYEPASDGASIKEAEVMLG